ncbi:MULTISPECIES: XRE family transcriptional regulator [Pantoea]|jgi:phage repressor protein C with HTH and peptisase S24 domain|uniref:Helix-turn-helix transcriptional regulator n=1 Tax=Pantoea eucrina TaxID=472693 RepID=A0ABS1Z0C5_9GAMM|nr:MULTISPECIES: helix-turn-helix transcriptional regulator [Pantoea]AIX51451.1 transcriptional regulator [Pantoea sp. PSNIH1]KAA6050935.1 helix-turn-helix transcriptional regulator [Pantoea sp. Bo_7]KAA6095288.1 helix-turn-helix transcriptional regulator [Pantoea sp. Bo_10]MBM0745851.1 helix-turn-helix transcriptional regulator [Pantoea eucrina]MCL9645516.1 helix-turn-helix transcriptional regulator [Pantoea eucrina]
MKIGDKIRQIRKANKMTLSELALRTDSDVGNLSRLERGIQGYSDGLLHKIAAALSVPVSELFSSNEANDTVDSYSVSSIIKKGRKDVYRIDVLDVSASAGDGSPSKDVVEVIRSIEYVPDQARVIFGNRPETSVKLINVRGDSMEGTIEPGDLIFVDVAVSTFDGDGIYVFDFNGDMFVKRLQKVKREIIVISDNPRYREWSISEEELSMLHVAGRVMLSQSQQFRRHG